MQCNFEWDFEKARKNLKKHKISFERSCTIFQDPRSLSVFDDEHCKDEDRWNTLGIDEKGRLLVVTHTFKEISNENILIRIISARRATKKEIQQYNQE
jgi:uncharacterized protein